MMNFKIPGKQNLILPCLLILIFFKSYSQDNDSLTFAKGRIITSLFGSLSNQQVDVGSNKTVSTTGYSIGTKSGYFVKNNWTTGVNFSLSRYEYKNTSLGIESENLVIGFWNRWYFVALKSAALHAELTPYYTATHQQNIFEDSGGSVITNEIASGGGFGIEPGVGFTYIINKNIGFGMTLTYSWAKLNIDIEDQILHTTTPYTHYVNQLGFSFNFQVYLDQFFF